ncbi:cell adhesion molecule CEACAM16-like [Pyxicephalus adspersus]|uniref:cell adhesion molecule CEACAM16-like n=1 Tax=Pyxicephalus adspersus TaxID=30357 RepID=UPI003B5B1C4A
MTSRTHYFCSLGIVSVLLSVWIDVAIGMMSIHLIPQNPVIGGSVTLSITGITERIWSSYWFKGPSADSLYLILSYYPGQDTPLAMGPLFHNKIKVFFNGSLQISNLNKEDEGNYIVKIKTDKQNYVSMHLKIYEMLGKPTIAYKTSISLSRPNTPTRSQTMCPSGNGTDSGKIAVIVIGTIVVILFLEIIVYFVLKKKKNSPTGAVYENVHIPQQNNYEMTFQGCEVI